MRDFSCRLSIRKGKRPVTTRFDIDGQYLFSCNICSSLQYEWKGRSERCKIRVSEFVCDMQVLFSYFRPLALDWADNISLPTRFSKATSEAIESGVLTRRARVEIHNAVATLILVHTSRPNSNDRDIICRRLVTKVPALKDSSPSGYVSLC